MKIANLMMPYVSGLGKSVDRSTNKLNLGSNRSNRIFHIVSLSRRVIHYIICLWSIYGSSRVDGMQLTSKRDSQTAHFWNSANYAIRVVSRYKYV